MRKAKAPGYRVLVKMIETDKEVEVKSKGGLILELRSQRDIELDQQGSTTGYVMDIGASAFEGSKEPWCKIGDKVQIYKHSGVLLDEQGDGHTYRMVQDVDIQVVYPEEREM